MKQDDDMEYVPQTCESCGAHWMQNCDCTEEEIKAARVRLVKLMSGKKIESVKFSEFIDDKESSNKQ